MDGAAEEADDRDTADRGAHSTRLTPTGVAAIVAGTALAALTSTPALHWLGVSLAALGIALAAAPLTRPSGTGDEEPVAVTLTDGRAGSAFVWSRFAPSMTIVVLVASACFLAGLGAVFLVLGLLAVSMFFWLFGLFVLGRAVRFLPALRGRRLVVTAAGVAVELRGRQVELPWATITAVDVGRPAAPAEAMGGAITLRTLEHELPGPEPMQRRLRNLAAPYGPGADIALPVAGLRHDPGALLLALERGRGPST